MSAPEAIQAAREAIRSLENVPNTVGGVTAIVVAALEAAILAERERCAKIAEAEAKYWLDDNLAWQAEASACLQVAAAIRSPKQSPEGD